MFDFNTAESPKKLNRDFILSKITDAMIFGYYFGKFDLKNLFPSAFGSGKHRDRNPSTGFYISTSGKIIYNHLNDREPKMDCFAFVCRKFNISFSEAIKRIALDFGLISGAPTPIADKVLKDLAKFDKSYKKDTKIHFVPMKFDSEAAVFWKSYHITREELKAAGIYQIKKLYINEIPIPNHNNALRFALTVPYKDELLTKVYSPGNNDRLKWVSNIPLDLPFGLEDLKKNSKSLFISKAQKDRIILKKFLPAVIATQNENKGSLMNKKVISKINFNFQTKYLGWDNDETGLESMEKLRPEGFIPVHVPIELLKEGIKDFSDLAKERGLGAVEELLIQNGVL